jgi:hypothetical protein
MNPSPSWTDRFWLALLLLLLCVGMARTQPPLYRLGAPNPPMRDPRLTTDNGIPGTGYYYYRDYPYPSLREALQQYGLFGRRLRTRTAATEARDVSFSPVQLPQPSLSPR